VVDKDSGAIKRPITVANSCALPYDPTDMNWSSAGANLYTRNGGTNQKYLQERVASLEGGEDCVAPASSAAALSGLFFAPLNNKFGVETTIADTTDPANVAAAIRPNTKLIHAVSLGHDESLIVSLGGNDERQHLYPEEFHNGFSRFSVGIEDAEDIISDWKQTMEKAGYHITEDPRRRSDGVYLMVILLGLYVIARQLGWTEFFQRFPAVSGEQMGYAALFLVGPPTSVHCIAMCGGGKNGLRRADEGVDSGNWRIGEHAQSVFKNTAAFRTGGHGAAVPCPGGCLRHRRRGRLHGGGSCPQRHRHPGPHRR